MTGRACETPCTVDRLFHDQLCCIQPKDGYRFSVDAVLLAGFCRLRKNDSVLDLGTGCGVLSLILALRQPQVCFAAMDLQPELVAIARRNVEQNGFGRRIQVMQGDLRQPETCFPAGSFSHVVCNPPYYQPTRGRKNANPGRTMARHGCTATFEQVASALAWFVTTGGRVSMVAPAAACAVLVAALKMEKIEPKRLRPVYGYPGEGKNAGARLVLIEGMRNGGPGLEFLPPLYIFQEKNGPYTEEMAVFYGEGR